MTVGEDEGVTWRHLLGDTRERLAEAGLENADQEARWLVQRAADFGTEEMALGLDQLALLRDSTFLYSMVERRVAGEPLQYVMQEWAFRTLDLYVDERVLIPRPETEVLAGMALEECRRLPARVAVDLGTGSGALALSLAVEWPGLEVWATDVSAGALEVASTNLAGLGQRGAAVRLAEGSWYAALPEGLAGIIDIIVANPPYVAVDEMDGLPAEVRDWEPREALCAGPSGLEDIATIVAGAPDWLARPGALLVEMAPHQSRRVAEMAGAAGFGSVSVWPDLGGRDRILLART